MHFPGAFGGGGKSMPRDCLGAVDRRPSLLQLQHPLRGDKAQGPNWITSIQPWPQRCLLASVACYQHLGSVSCPLPNPSAGAWLWVSPLTPPSSTKCPSLQIFHTLPPHPPCCPVREGFPKHTADGATPLSPQSRSPTAQRTQFLRLTSQLPHS